MQRTDQQTHLANRRITMSVQIALDATTNDIIKLDGGGIARVNEGRYTIQLVKNKLLTLLGEWPLDPSKGWLNLEDYKRNPDLFDIEMRARQIILGVKGVLEIVTLSLALSQRILTLTFEANTIYGTINLTIPWST